jgi:hypothetical protein
MADADDIDWDRDDAAPATKADAAPPRPPIDYVPQCSHLREALHLEPSLFTVRELDLLRKALDELTHGLKWYVLYTLTHSAVWHRLNPEQDALVFRDKRPMAVTDDEIHRAAVSPDVKILVGDGPEGALQTMQQFLTL